MKNGLICYDKIRHTNNAYFAERLLNELEDFGFKMKLCMVDDVESFNDIDFVIMRTYEQQLTKKLEDKKIRVFNNSSVSEICNDKFLTYEFFKNSKLPILPYMLIERNTFSNEIIKFPTIIKSRFGHGGTEVFIANNMQQIKECFDKTGQNSLISQQMAKTLGKDLRTYVIGGKVFKSIMRESKTDFRSNFSLGGTAENHILNKAESDIIDIVLKRIKIDFAGVDLIYDGKKPVLNEIEDIVGSRMLYLKGVDAAQAFASYIFETLSKN